MRDFHLRFFIDQRWPDGLELSLSEKENFDFSKIPQNGGAYVLGTSDGTMFQYPWGSSPVFYIGQSSNLKKRLNDHSNLIVKAKTDHDDYWWPRYQYGASFGADIAWYTVRGTQNPNKLESDLITDFYTMFGSIPVANGTWPSGLKPKIGKRDD